MESRCKDTLYAPNQGPVPKAELRSWSFFGLVSVQFLTVANDNSYRWLVVPIGYHLIGIEHKGLILTLGLACFVVPYIVLAAAAGYLADRFSKKRVIGGTMLMQAAVLMLGMGAIVSNNVIWLFSTLTLMGAQGALLGPAKNGTIPETIRAERISGANGVMGMASVMAAVVGSVLGNTLYVVTAPVGRTHWWISAVVLIGISVLGWLSSLLITKQESADPKRKPPIRFLRQTLQDLKSLIMQRRLLAAACASAFFWFLAALAQVNVYLLGTTTLHINQEEVGILLAVLALGVAAGSILAGLWSGDAVEPGITPIGAGGIALTSILMYVVTQFQGIGMGMFYASALLLFCMGVCSGLYEVPLSAFLQHYSPESARGRILAATNFLTFAAMLLASALFWIARSLLGESAGLIFLIAGLITFVVVIGMWSILYAQIVRALRRLRSATGG